MPRDLRLPHRSPQQNASLAHVTPDDVASAQARSDRECTFVYRRLLNAESTDTEEPQPPEPTP